MVFWVLTVTLTYSIIVTYTVSKANRLSYERYPM